MPVPTLQELRKAIFDGFVGSGRAPTVEELMHRYGVGRREIVDGLRALQASHHVLLLPGTERILMANPFSNLATSFRVTSGSRTYFANCAWDAVAIHIVLQREVRVDAFCHHCGEPITFELRDGVPAGPIADEARVYLGTPVSKWYDNLVLTCSNTMVFFRAESHLVEWRRDHPDWNGETLTIGETLRIVAPISAHRADLDYQMPSKHDLMEHWRSVGRSGGFWTF